METEGKLFTTTMTTNAIHVMNSSINYNYDINSPNNNNNNNNNNTMNDNGGRLSPSTNISSSSSANSPNNNINVNVVVSPCAACKILRRRCADKCVLAPYFPPTEPFKFTIAHRVFGASNIIKLLQELPEEQRTDAVSSMVYEANARIRDPVYGCVGAISQLQRHVSDLQAQLATTQAELFNMQSQQANLIALICMEITQSNHQQELALVQQQQQYNMDTCCFIDETNMGT